MAIYRGSGGAGDATNDITINRITELNQEAEASAEAAASSASSAAGSASTATNQAGLATTAKNDAVTAQGLAEGARDTAVTAQGLAENAQSYAEEWATKAEDSLVSTDAGGDGSTDYSALHHAAKASASATSASGSATTATTKAGEASDDADDASKLAVNPEDSQYTLSDGTTTGYSALHYNAKAGASASAASTSESNASDSASDASKLAVNAEDSQYTLSDGTTTGYSALHYNAKAQAAKTAAENARDATLTAYDNFDDRYLGAKASDPSVDNDGDALVAGALYFNTTDEVMKLYTGSAWVAAYVSGADYLAKANNLSDLPSASTARTNLGLGTAATLDVGTSANNIVQLDGTGALPAVDGSNLTNVSSVANLNDLTDVDTTGIADGETIVYNASTTSFEPGQAGSNTAVVGWENQITVAENYTITSGNNMVSAGPVTIDSGFTVTVPTGSRWVVV